MPEVNRSHPVAKLAETAEGLRAMHGRAFPWIYTAILCGVVVALASLPLIQVTLSVRAPAVVRPATERVDLRLPLGGRIAEVLSGDNTPVTAGLPLLVMETPDIDERLERNSVQQHEKRCLLLALDALVATSESSLSGIMRVAETHGNTSIPSVKALWQDALYLMTQMETQEMAAAKADREFARAEALAKKGVVTRRELDEASYTLERTQAEVSQLQALARARWQTRRESESSALADLVSEASRLDAIRAQATIRAPVQGTVQGFLGLKPGAVLSAGQVIGSVSPDDRLIIEAAVSSRDISQVYAGQPVRLQIDAFPYTEWGLLEGRVAAIAADATDAPVPTFKIWIEPTRSQLALANGAVGRLSKGMTGLARFVTARRTLLQILYQDASEWTGLGNRL
jgi:membrane fusion protein, peptide pheromone/bacteriocin exporter